MSEGLVPVLLGRNLKPDVVLEVPVSWISGVCDGDDDCGDVDGSEMVTFAEAPSESAFAFVSVHWE